MRIALVKALQRRTRTRHDRHAVARTVQLGFDHGGNLDQPVLHQGVGLSLALAVVEDPAQLPCASTAQTAASKPLLAAMKVRSTTNRTALQLAEPVVIEHQEERVGIACRIQRGKGQAIGALFGSNGLARGQLVALNGLAWKQQEKFAGLDWRCGLHAQAQHVGLFCPCQYLNDGEGPWATRSLADELLLDFSMEADELPTEVDEALDAEEVLSASAVPMPGTRPAWLPGGGCFSEVGAWERANGGWFWGQFIPMPRSA